MSTGQNFGLLMIRAGTRPRRPHARAAGADVSFLSVSAALHRVPHGPSADPLIRSRMPLLVSSRESRLVVFVSRAISGSRVCRVRVPASAMLAPLTLFATAVHVVRRAGADRMGHRHRSAGALAARVCSRSAFGAALGVTSYYARREAETESNGAWAAVGYAGTPAGRRHRPLRARPWLASYVFRSDFHDERASGLFTAIVNIHHFILTARSGSPRHT